MLSVQSRARRLRPAALLLALLPVVAAACLAPQASAWVRYPPSGLRFFADVGISPPPSRSLIAVDSIRGSLRVVSIRAVRDVRAAVPVGSAGKTVGKVTFAIRGGAEPSEYLKLGMPLSTSGSKLVLARDGQLSVVLRPSGRRSTGSGGANNLILSIHGLPTGTTSVSVTFDGAGRGVLGTTHGCPVKPTLNLYAVREGASPVSVNSRISCGTPPNKRSASVAPGSRRGVAPLLVPNSAGKLHTSSSAHTSFRLPTGSWHASRTEAGDLSRNGAYFRTTRLDGKRCVVSVSVGGRGQQHRPVLNTTSKSDHIQHGTTGAVHWLSAWSLLPPTPPLPYAKAYRPAPSWVSWNWASFNLSAQTIGSATAACRRSMLRVDLAAVAGSVGVARGSLTRG